jgi:hypothetical protein
MADARLTVIQIVMNRGVLVIDPAMVTEVNSVIFQALLTIERVLELDQVMQVSYFVTSFARHGPKLGKVFFDFIPQLAVVHDGLR